MNRIFYILVICCQAFGVSAQSVADAGLFTYSAAGTVTASLGGNGVAWGPDAFAVFRNSAQGALADAKVIAGYAVSSWMPGWDLADRHWIHDAGGLFTFGGRQAVLTGVRYLNLPTVELTDEEGNLQSRFTPYALEVDAGYAYAWRGKLAAGLTCRYFRLDQKTLLTTYVACDLSLFYRDSLAGRPYFWQAGMQLSNIAEAYLPLKIEYAVSAGWEQGAHRVMCTGGIAHQELAYGFCTLGSAGVEYSFRKKIFLRGGYRSGRPAKGIFACTALGGGMKWHGIGLDATWRLASSDSPQRNAWHLALTFAI